MVSQKVEKQVFMSFPDFGGNQVRHDDFRTYYEFIGY
jgi:hypothetical protein